MLGPEVTITVCPDGPLLVRGPAELLDGDGNALTRNRETVALCRCGRSGIAPFCDSTHKKRRATTGSAGGSAS
ncbi:CDGSH iron-sulfur domain-containing protein [Rhodococcus sp. X156]|uniref:CDGSH iron-sulfur domain-containing protein n=1 Tax=Rhodococcus sp. X156 TaxID=2499145 RepID=UPI001F494498|nr:CDGSH iron-sulfur domain-containing protein [Rhodococcus sp. X156]